MSALGIDFGDATTIAAFVNSAGVATLVPDRQDAAEFITSSVVYIGEDGCLVGKAAEDLAAADERSTAIAGIKTRLASAEPLLVDYAGRQWGARGLVALVLRKIARDSNNALGVEPDVVCVAVPPYFNDVQRRALREAVSFAGLSNARMIEEPLAAAAYHGFGAGRQNRNVLVLDFGASAFSATLMRSTEDGLSVLATQSSTTLSLGMVERILVEALGAEFLGQHGQPLPTDAMTLVAANRMGADILRAFCTQSQSGFKKTLVLGGRAFDFCLSVRLFSSLIEPYLSQVIAVAEECLRNAASEWQIVDRIILTGGGVLVPMVSQRIKTVSGKPQAGLLSEHPLHAVAYGAALIASQQSASGSGYESVCANDLGITIFDRSSNNVSLQVLIKRNTHLPASAKTTFYTNRDDQKRLVLQVGQCAGTTEPVVSLGYFEFGPIARPRKNYPIDVTLSYDADGMVTVSAYDPDTGQAMEQILGGEGGQQAEWAARQKTWVRELRINE